MTTPEDREPYPSDRYPAVAPAGEAPDHLSDAARYLGSTEFAARTIPRTAALGTPVDCDGCRDLYRFLAPCRWCGGTFCERCRDRHAAGACRRVCTACGGRVTDLRDSTSCFGCHRAWPVCLACCRLRHPQPDPIRACVYCRALTSGRPAAPACAGCQTVEACCPACHAARHRSPVDRLWVDVLFLPALAGSSLLGVCLGLFLAARLDLGPVLAGLLTFTLGGVVCPVLTALGFLIGPGPVRGAAPR